MRIVIDTNVLISALFFGGKPKKLLELWHKEKFEIIYSQEILNEYLAVLEEFRPWSPDSGVQHFLALLSLHGIPVNTVPVKGIICRDPNDQNFIETALAGNAQHIVSGDKDLLVLKDFGRGTILTVNELLKKLST